jgi:ABC-type multidrug transport system permease subunit
MAQTLISIPFIIAIAAIFSVTAYFLVGLKTSGFGHFLLDLSLALMVAEAMVVTVRYGSSTRPNDHASLTRCPQCCCTVRWCHI